MSDRNEPGVIGHFGGVEEIIKQDAGVHVQSTQDDDRPGVFGTLTQGGHNVEGDLIFGQTGSCQAAPWPHILQIEDTPKASPIDLEGIVTHVTRPGRFY